MYVCMYVYMSFQSFVLGKMSIYSGNTDRCICIIYDTEYFSQSWTPQGLVYVITKAYKNTLNI